MKKYIKPHSLTFWAGVAPLASGLIIAASHGVPEIEPLASVLQSVFGDISAGVLINTGLAAIGLRAALPIR